MANYYGDPYNDDEITGSASADNIYGYGGNDLLFGGYGNDYVEGGTGDDYVEGGYGNDTLAGGDGADTLRGDAGDDLIIAGSGNDTLFGGDGNDALDGGDGDDTLTGGTGWDVLAGGTGNDTYVAHDAEDPIEEYADEGIDTVQSYVTYSLPSEGDYYYVENLTLLGSGALNGTGNDLDNILTGNSGNNVLDGGNGNDTLDGGAGADTLTGGAGNDTYVVDNAADTVDEVTGGGGTDLVQASVSYVLGTDVENLTLTGTAAINGTGNGLNNTLTGNGAANTLLGYGGADTLTGGAGSDTYGVDNAGDVVVENASEGTDTVNSYITYTLGANVENLTLNEAAAVNGTGNGLNNTLTGNSAANTLSGMDGNDYLPGGSGNDTLNGGNDNDSLDGGSGNDTLDGGDGNDLLNGWADADTLTGGTGTDTFAFGTLPNGTNADTVTDFVSGTDTLRFRDGATYLNIGDVDNAIDSAVSLAGPGGFGTGAELVIVSGNITGAITATSAAAAIGSASGTYTVGNTRLFAVDNGTDSALYRFQAGDADAAVEAGELQLIGTLQGTGAAGTAVTDYEFL
jgi:Ca2+-binding RTX toxin-like protein